MSGSKTPFGVFLPAYAETFLFFTESKVTADFMVDALEIPWPTLEERFNLHTLVINADCGSENNSRRTQFIKRMVEFAHHHSITIRLAHYPPYHSKYNSIERVKGVYETGVKLTKKAMMVYEDMIERLPGLDNWFVDIPPCPA